MAVACSCVEISWLPWLRYMRFLFKRCGEIEFHLRALILKEFRLHGNHWKTFSSAHIKAASFVLSCFVPFRRNAAEGRRRDLHIWAYLSFYAHIPIYMYLWPPRLRPCTLFDDEQWAWTRLNPLNYLLVSLRPYCVFEYGCVGSWGSGTLQDQFPVFECGLLCTCGCVCWLFWGLKSCPPLTVLLPPSTPITQ